MENYKKVFITGAAGFIGSHLTKKLLQEGLEVGILKREHSNVWRIKDVLDKVRVYNADLRDNYEISKAISHFGPDIVFHLATYYAVGHTSDEIVPMIESNVLGATNLLEASKESVGLFVNTSSGFVYKESADKLRENSALSPFNLYALTKMQAEQACTFYAETYGLRAVTFRIFPPYGPADHERRLVPYAINSLLRGDRPKMTTGNQRWDFIFVDDIVAAYLSLLSVSDLPNKHEIINVGTGNAVSVREVVMTIKDIIGSEAEPDWGAIPHRENEIWSLFADIRKARKLLGWRPKTQLETGLELTVKWYEEFLERREENAKRSH